MDESQYNFAEWKNLIKKVHIHLQSILENTSYSVKKQINNSSRDGEWDSREGRTTKGQKKNSGASLYWLWKWLPRCWNLSSCTPLVHAVFECQLYLKKLFLKNHVLGEYTTLEENEIFITK